MKPLDQQTFNQWAKRIRTPPAYDELMRIAYMHNLSTDALGG